MAVLVYFALSLSIIALAFSIFTLIDFRRKYKQPSAHVHNWNITTSDNAGFTGKQSATQVARILAARERNITFT